MLIKQIDELAKRIKDNHSTKKPQFDVYYKYITISHSVKKIIMSKLINSYSFWRSSYPFGGLLILLAVLSYWENFGHVFLIVVVNLTWRQMFLRKLQLAAKYWNI